MEAAYGFASILSRKVYKFTLSYASFFIVFKSGVYWGFADKNCGHYTTTHFASVDNEQNASARVFV